MTHSDIDRAFDGALFARQMLQQGFTSARDAGGGPETAAVRDAIDAGKISGPRFVDFARTAESHRRSRAIHAAFSILH